MRPVSVGTDGDPVQATTLDLSETGIAVWGPEGPPPKAVELTFELDDGEPLALRGVVVRQFESDGGAVWGIEFRELESSARARLRAFVDAQP